MSRRESHSRQAVGTDSRGGGRAGSGVDEAGADACRRQEAEHASARELDWGAERDGRERERERALEAKRQEGRFEEGEPAEARRCTGWRSKREPRGGRGVSPLGQARAAKCTARSGSSPQGRDATQEVDQPGPPLDSDPNRRAWPLAAVSADLKRAALDFTSDTTSLRSRLSLCRAVDPCQSHARRCHSRPSRLCARPHLCPPRFHLEPQVRRRRGRDGRGHCRRPAQARLRRREAPAQRGRHCHHRARVRAPLCVARFPPYSCP